ncbi:MAG: TonB family protein [Hyphomicrobiaceae bacterium]
MLDVPFRATHVPAGQPDWLTGQASDAQPVLRAMSIAPVEAPHGSGRFGRAVLAAALVHVLGLAALGLHQPATEGGGGVTLDAVSVEVVLVAPAAAAARRGQDVIAGTAGDGVAAGEAAIRSPAGAAARHAKDVPDRPRDLDAEEPSARTSAPVVAARADDEPADMPMSPEAKPKVETHAEAEHTATAKNAPPSAAPAPSPPAAVARNGNGVPLTTGSLPSAAKPKPAANPGEVRRFTQDVARLLSRHRPKTGRGRWHGSVRIAFAIGLDGGLTFVRVAKTSGNDALDAVALSTVRGVHFPRPPAGMTADQLTYVIPYHFR